MLFRSQVPNSVNRWLGIILPFDSLRSEHPCGPNRRGLTVAMTECYLPSIRSFIIINASICPFFLECGFPDQAESGTRNESSRNYPLPGRSDVDGGYKIYKDGCVDNPDKVRPSVFNMEFHPSTLTLIMLDVRFSLTMLVSVMAICTIGYYRSPWRGLPPGPPGLPFIGNPLALNERRIWLTFTKWSKLYGG